MLGLLKGMVITLKHAFRGEVAFQYPDEKRADLALRFRGELKLKGMLNETTPGGSFVTTKEMPPCMATCPSNMRIREYVGLVSMGKFLEAVKVMKEDNPLPLVCGRVCPHPCESNCKRGDKDEPVAINPIKRFAADFDYQMQKAGKVPKPQPNITKKDKVAVVGAGPAGLTCAYYLAKKGYPVTIFEKLPVAGGFLAVGIPDYRLPKDILQAEIDQILALGVELKLNTEVKDLKSLFKQGYKAIFLGIGAHKPMRLEIEGEDLEGVIPGEEFLKDIALKRPTKLGKKVAVVGGGNTAIDCARVSLREGAEKVYILYRRTKAEMPAHHLEIEDAEEEGVEIKLLVAPKRIIGDKNGRVCQIECLKMKLGEKDKSGRRRPVPIEGSEFLLEVDTVMSAISRSPEVDWLDSSGVKIHSRWGTIAADPKTGETSLEGVFAGGDGSLGPNIAIAAIGTGKRAAISIDAYLSGQDIKAVHQRDEWEALVKPFYLEEARQQGAKLEPEVRLNGYPEVELGLTEQQALTEAKRCLSCQTGVCIGCGICVESCPTEAITIEVTQDKNGRKIHKYDINVGQCIFCGLCVEACPTTALYHTYKYELSEYKVANFLKHKDYWLRDEAQIEQEGWTKPHKHVATMPLLDKSGGPRKNSNEEWTNFNRPESEKEEVTQ